jgi:hypothetical protein
MSFQKQLNRYLTDREFCDRSISKIVFTHIIKPAVDDLELTMRWNSYRVVFLKDGVKVTGNKIIDIESVCYSLYHGCSLTIIMNNLIVEGDCKRYSKRLGFHDI